MHDTQTDVTQLVARLDRSIGAMTQRRAILTMYGRLADKAGVALERPAYLVLKQLAAEGPMRITDLATHHGVEPSTMSRHVQSLESAGLLTKGSDTDDRRVCLAEATPDGQRMVGRMETERANMLDAVISDWDDEDAERFVGLMERFVEGLIARVDQK